MTRDISRLTLDEKASLVSGASFWRTRSIEAHGIAGATLTDGPHGVRLQKESADHLGLFDSEPATAFPTASATGSTWNPELIAEMAKALGAECRALGVDILLGPGVNIKRSPLCGRNFEYFSEDPLVAGKLGASWVEGLQSQGVGASLKHFAANNQETDRMRVSVDVDERTLREIYLPAFERIVRNSAPATVMCSYNRINGVPASENEWLLTDVLRNEWGFDGYVVSDWGAVRDPVAALQAGVDLEMPGVGNASAERIVAAVRDGVVAESILDDAVSRVLSVHDRLREARDDAPAPDFDKHNELAYRLAVEGTVLLTNEDGILPLNPEVGGTIAVIGEFARHPRFQGGGSSHIVPARLDNALEALHDRVRRPIEFAPGFTFGEDDDFELHEQALAIAERAEVVVLFLGLPAEDESEGFDRVTLLLPATQRDLLRKVMEVNRRVVVVLSNGGVVTLSGIANEVPAILETWLGGQASGAAIIDIIIGDAEPGGRLAETIPLALEHTPSHVNWPGNRGRVLYGERIYIGYRWYDVTQREVAFPFGHGLGYTTFTLSGFEVRASSANAAHLTCRVIVENTGQRAGSEVIQLYIASPSSRVDRPVRELRDFAKIRLEPGERRVVDFELEERAFAYWGPSGWTVESGVYVVEVGTSSRNLPLRESITLTLPEPRTSLNQESTVSEWLDNPVGRQVLNELLGALAGESRLIDSEEALKMVGGIPLRSMIGFADTQGIDADATVAALLERVSILQA